MSIDATGETPSGPDHDDRDVTDLGPDDLPGLGDVLRPDQETAFRRLELVRGLWGLAVLVAPGRFLSAVGTGGDQTMVVIGRILGARHLTQAVLSGARPSPEVLAMGVWVDAVHALTALGLAAVSPSRTGVGLADAVGAAGWAAAGYYDLVNPRSVQPAHTRRRDALARWTLARVPAGRRLRERADHERGRTQD